MVASDINEWINKQPDKRLAPAPLVIHVTDGFPYEEERSEDMARTDALRAAQEIMNLDIKMLLSHQLQQLELQELQMIGLPLRQV